MKSRRQSASQGQSSEASGPGESTTTGAETEVKILSDIEQSRCEKVFRHCDTFGEGLDLDAFCVALALMGQIEKVEHVREVFKTAMMDRIPVDIFLDLVTKLRLRNVSEEINDDIQEMFDALYEGTCPDDNQRDDGGNRLYTFLNVSNNQFKQNRNPNYGHSYRYLHHIHFCTRTLSCLPTHSLDSWRIFSLLLASSIHQIDSLLLKTSAWS